jgi:hypothetical protein
MPVKISSSSVHYRGTIDPETVTRMTQLGGPVAQRSNPPSPGRRPAATTSSRPSRCTADDTQITRRIPAADDGYEVDVQTDRLADVSIPPRSSSKITQAVPTTTSLQQRQRTMTQDPETRPPLRRKRWWHDQHPLTYVGVALFSLLLAWYIGINVFSWFMNTWGDPLTYTQIAHKDSLFISIDGHVEQAHAILGLNNHLKLIVEVDGEANARTIEGPLVVGADPSHLVFSITRLHGSTINVEALPQREVLALLIPSQPSVNWTVDLSSKQGGTK